MATNKELERRLLEWTGEYSGGRYENLGYPSRSWLATAIKYRGRAPEGMSAQVVQIGTPADEVETGVVALERSKDGYKPGRVLRAEYWMTRAPEEQKLQALRAMGLPMSREGFYIHLRLAKFHIAAWLRLPISEEASEEPSVFRRFG